MQRGTVCNASNGLCEDDTVCTGNSAMCPSKTFKSSSTICREKDGDCDIEEYCTGVSPDCPDDILVPSSAICRVDGDFCSSFAYCTGNSGICLASEDSTMDVLKKLSNGCIVYQCDKINGFQAIAKCTNNEVCINDECVVNDTINKQWAVDVDLQVNSTDSMMINSYQITVELSKISDLSADDIVVAIQYDQDGNLTGITVYVDDEKQANTIVQTLKSFDESDNCDSILCRSDHVHKRQITDMLFLEGAHSYHHGYLLQAMTVLSTFISLFFHR